MRRFFYILATTMAIGATMLPYFTFSQTAGSHRGEISDLNKKITEKRGTIDDLEKSIAKVKKDISKKQLEATSLKNQLAILDDRITEVSLDVELTEQKLDALGLEIQTLEYDISGKEQVIDRQKVIIAELVRAIAYERDAGYVEILATYRSFSDFYSRVQALEKTEQDIGKSAKALRLAKDDLENKKQETEVQRASYADLQADLLEKQQDLKEQIDAKENLFSQTKQSEKTYTVLLVSLRKQYQQIEGEITSIEQEVRKKLEEQEKLERLNGGDASTLSWPSQSHYITAYFYDPNYPFRHVFEHNAVDIRAAQGTSIKAAATGYVGRAKRCTTSSCYSYVMIIHSGGISTVYGHLSRILVEADQFVTRGDVIGMSGGTPGTVGAGPFVTGPHLHFEVRKDGIPVNPLQYLIK